MDLDMHQDTWKIGVHTLVIKSKNILSNDQELINKYGFRMEINSSLTQILLVRANYSRSP